MFQLNLPQWPDEWLHFARWQDSLFAAGSAILILLMIVWWQQQTHYWFRIIVSILLASILLCIGSYYIFVVPPNSVGCSEICVGWRGYPHPVALFDIDHRSKVYPIDFGLNLLIIWFIFLGMSVMWRIAGIAIQWSSRSFRTQLAFIFSLCIIPWAIMPRILEPPQPLAQGEAQRIANNAQRAAEFTYNVTGFWIHRLALEDIQQSVPDNSAETIFDTDNPAHQVCLRGYTYFYVPWRRYRIVLDATGVTALDLTEVGLDGSCWEKETLE
ncbi:hypothetical protein KFU94_21635 [Chloroflexi bacterium TSY]|nr:hypothetical protein [Chloroflexi bacterium TSY]